MIALKFYFLFVSTIVGAAEFRHKHSYHHSHPYYNQGRSFVTQDTVIIDGTGSQAGNVQSSRHCPEPFYGVPFVHYGVPGKCYLTGVKGPCPENMRLFPQHGSSLGYCDCNCDAYVEEKYHSPKSFCTGRTDSGDVRSLAWVKTWGSCQPLLEQSYCPSGFVLVMDNDPKKGPVCERAVCDVLAYDLKFYDQSSGKCERVDGVCHSTMTNEGTYQILDSDWVPQCVQTTEEARLKAVQRGQLEQAGKGQAWSVNNLSCPGGSSYSRFTGHCERRRPPTGFGVG